jgi:crossover junction endodeoxyribonuclease RuvC
MTLLEPLATVTAHASASPAVACPVLLGIDPGIGRLGFGLVTRVSREAPWHALAWGVIETHAKPKLSIRSKQASHPSLKAVGAAGTAPPSPQTLIAEASPGQWSKDTRRLLELGTDMADLLAQTQPTMVMMERLFFFRNVSTALPVSQARGVVLYELAKQGIPVREMTPMQIKQHLTGGGAADKKEVQRAIQHALNLSVIPHPDDAADALAMAYVLAMQWDILGNAQVP